MERHNVLLGNPYEELIGFSRAVRVGPHISVGGTAPIGEDGSTVGVGDVAAQTRRCFEIIQTALEAAGASLDDVVRTRMMFTDISDFEAAAMVRKEFVGHVRPVDTIVEVSRFVNPDWLIEVEADALVAILTDQSCHDEPGPAGPGFVHRSKRSAATPVADTGMAGAEWISETS